jgi:hypothetical protein
MPDGNEGEAVSLIRSAPGTSPLEDALRRVSRSERRGLARIDRAAAMRATLTQVLAVLDAAEDVIAAGWLQEAWFAYRDRTGREWAVGTADAATVAAEAVSRACLVGAVLMGAGGPAAATTPQARRGIEAVWHVLHRDERDPVPWCSGPVVGGAHVRDLTLWNDRPGRSAAEVREVLGRARRLVERELESVVLA